MIVGAAAVEIHIHGARSLKEKRGVVRSIAQRLRNRFYMVEVWERMGVDVRAVLDVIVANPPEQQTDFQHMLFAKIVPNCKKLGILDAGDGWLRRKFEELNIIQFEDWVDTSDEYEQFALDNRVGA